MKTIYFFSIFILLVVTGCDNNINQIIKHQNELIVLGRSKEIINDNERSFYMLISYSPENIRNEYVFQKEGKERNVYYTLFRDSIQFSPDNVININKKSTKYKEEICNYYLKISRILKSYKIKSLSGEIYRNSSKLTIYIENGEILIYQPNVDISKNKDFQNFKEIKEGWYLLK